MINVILCDDHAMIRRGIRETLSEMVDVCVVGEAGTYNEARELLFSTPCDVLVLDINLPGRSGLDLLSSMRQSHPHIHVLIVSMYAEDQYALRCLRSGAKGYINKAGDPANLVTAVRTVTQGRKFVTPEISEMLVDSLSMPSAETPHANLSERELQTLIKIASGKRLSDVAQELTISPKTVSVYRARLLEKLKLKNNSELTVFAIRNELV